MTAALDDPVRSARAVRAWEHHLGHEVDPVALRAQLAAGDLPSAIHRAAIEAGEQRALSIGDRSITHRELDRDAGRVAAWIRMRGVRPDDRVVLCGSNSVALVIAHRGILRAGAVVALAGETLNERELRHVVSNAAAIAAFASGEAVGRLV
jgi:acyl-CoA synthetase (AMP-forming)/AMP-acid ligase II